MRSAFAVACVPVALALVIFAARTHTLPLSGDEPHYLIMADSVAADHDLDLRNNYLNDFDSRRIYGLVIPHVFNTPAGWMPYHYPGLAVLVALPFRMGGAAAARVALCGLTALLPLSLFGWFRRRLNGSPARARATAAWLTLALTISEPMLFGSSRIYPDLPAGALAVALFIHVVEALEGAPLPVWSWPLFWLAGGLLPWLHAKYAASALLLAAGAAAALWRQRGHESAFRARGALATAPLFAVGPALLMLFNASASGSVFGFHRIAELTTEFGRGAEIFLGLHLDQSQGMFVQQPLLVAGLAAWPAFAVRHRSVAVLWALLYLSLVVPNALQLARYGGGGPSGRFGWSAAWLWAVPIGFVVAEHYERLAPWVRRAAIGGWIYQLALATRWLADPDVLFPVLDERLSMRDSLFPVALRGALPSYYFWDFSSYWTYAPNLAAMLLVATMVAAAARASAPSHRR